METVNNRKKDVETNKALKEANRVNEAAVARSEAHRYAAEVTIPDLQNSIRQTKNAISILVVYPPESIVRDSSIPYKWIQISTQAFLRSYWLIAPMCRKPNTGALLF